MSPRSRRIEARTNHDVKAVEVLAARASCKRAARRAAAARMAAFRLHLGRHQQSRVRAHAEERAQRRCLLPQLDGIGATARTRSRERHAAVGMLARTHGQTATPTTVGKELANVAARLESQRAGLERVAILGKMNGAVGNFNAHVAALPQVDWPAFSARFVDRWASSPNAYTTQIEPHDWIAEYCHALMRANTVLLDLARDMWSYISLGYFKQRLIAGEVGSSTMPHKVNPIDFENAEGNLGLANALLGHFADKLPISRLQRDLTDSTVLRNLGVAIGHSVARAISRSPAGLEKLELDRGARGRGSGSRLGGAGRGGADCDARAWHPRRLRPLESFTRGRPMDEARDARVHRVPGSAGGRERAPAGLDAGKLTSAWRRVSHGAHTGS